MDMLSRPNSKESVQSAAEAARVAPRESLFLLGRLWMGDSQAIDVRIRNLSATGMMIESREFAEMGQDVEIEIKGLGRLKGKIAWIAEKRMGIALKRQIDPSLARQQVGGGMQTPDHVKPQITRRPGLKIA
jgi:hypothetical protein